ncbi:MAG: bis(5'-nucleosyl)-tetraphosphatase (symmetrical) YqeK [Clostridia bacterium]|nr:bis(5'-nucleosyl)-tetraphosphatase (symmetrical) YqeK [Clostridia bacterium]
MKEINQQALQDLRERVTADMSEKRARHTLAVEQMAARLAALYCPEKEQMLRAAALLHDVTKEWKTERHVAFLQENGIEVTPLDLAAPKTLHARTAALLIPVQYTEYARPEIISAVRFHTTGREEMALTEQIVYLADYIDESRTFADCVALRHAFWDAEPQNMCEKERLTHLLRVLVQSFDMTVTGLLADGAPVSSDTFCARNSLILQLKVENQTEN